MYIFDVKFLHLINKVNRASQSERALVPKVNFPFISPIDIL